MRDHGPFKPRPVFGSHAEEALGGGGWEKILMLLTYLPPW
jgi:hypothetical protein